MKKNNDELAEMSKQITYSQVVVPGVNVSLHYLKIALDDGLSDVWGSSWPLVLV